MTVDDESSIYVGGLPYEINEEALRRAFYVFGAVVAVKVINDRTVRGKCYGFVTFANPRSAVQAIKEMDGKTIKGRVVRVNGVRTRDAWRNVNRESSRHGRERSIDDDRLHDQYSHRDRSQDLSKDRERSDDHTEDHYVEGDRYRDYDRHMTDLEHDRVRKRERDWERESDHEIEQQRNNGHQRSGDNDKDHHFPELSRHGYDDRGGGEFSSEAFSDDQDEVRAELDKSKIKLGELRKEISQMEDLAAVKREAVSKLKEKYQRLEDSLISAKKLTSHHRNLLVKLHKCYLQTRDYDDKFKRSEQDLKRLVDSTMEELETIADA